MKRSKSFCQMLHDEPAFMYPILEDMGYTTTRRGNLNRAIAIARQCIEEGEMPDMDVIFSECDIDTLTQEEVDYFNEKVNE